MKNVHVCLECTKTRSPEIGTVSHWRLPDVDIFHTDPSLLSTLKLHRNTILGLTEVCKVNTLLNVVLSVRCMVMLGRCLQTSVLLLVGSLPINDR